MHIGVPLETHAGETRVAATPETVKKLVGQGHQVTVQAGAGVSASIPDSAYEAVGASIGNDAAAAAHRITDSVPVICVRHPSYGGQTQFQRQISELYGRPMSTGSLF